MSSGTAKEYEDFARDCVRLANQADSPELREKLLQPGARVDACRYGRRRRGQRQRGPMVEGTQAKIERWQRLVDEHRAELEAMHSPEGRRSLQSVIDSYERMIALIQRRAEKP